MGIKGNSGIRSNFSATVTLGLVSFPVKFITAAKENGVNFNQLHGQCKSRINQNCCQVRTRPQPTEHRPHTTSKMATNHLALQRCAR